VKETDSLRVKLESKTYGNTLSDVSLDFKGFALIREGSEQGAMDPPGNPGESGNGAGAITLIYQDDDDVAPFTSTGSTFRVISDHPCAPPFSGLACDEAIKTFTNMQPNTGYVATASCDENQIVLRQGYRFQPASGGGVISSDIMSGIHVYSTLPTGPTAPIRFLVSDDAIGQSVSLIITVTCMDLLP